MASTEGRLRKSYDAGFLPIDTSCTYFHFFRSNCVCNFVFLCGISLHWPFVRFIIKKQEEEMESRPLSKNRWMRPGRKRLLPGPASAAEEARKAAEAAALAVAVPPPRPPLPAEVAELPRPSAAALAGRAPTPPKRAKHGEPPLEGPMFTTLLQDATVEESKAVQFTCRLIIVVTIT